MELLTGKSVLVTASTQGIGLAIAKLAIQEGASNVIINGRNHTKLESARRSISEIAGNKCKVHMIPGDLSQSEIPEKVIKTAVEITNGNLDTIINSAGVSTRGNIFDTDEHIWDEIFDLNTRAAFLLSSFAINHFLKNNISGSIVHNVSINAVCGERALLPYSMSKAALENLCKNLGHDMAMSHAEHFAATTSKRPWIRVNGVLTGWVYTPGEEVYKRKENPDAPTDWHENPPLAAVPSGKMTQPEEIARVFAFLASPLARFINGQTWTCEQFCLSGSPPRTL